VSPIAGSDYPGSYGELLTWFPDDEACRDYLDWLRWREGWRCPACGGDQGWLLGSSEGPQRARRDNRSQPLGAHDHGDRVELGVSGGYVDGAPATPSERLGGATVGGSGGRPLQRARSREDPDLTVHSGIVGCLG